MVVGIVKRHRGAISVESEPGRGTVFRVLFPLLDPSPETFSPVSLEPLRGKGRILFVDDEPTITEIGQASLEYLGYDVVSLSSSTDALEAFRAEPKSFDLVITDLTMPGLSGRELARGVQRIRPDVPVILCTGYSEQILPEKANELGIREVLCKPVAVRELARAVHRAICTADDARLVLAPTLPPVLVPTLPPVLVPTLPRGNPCGDAPASYSPVAAIAHANVGHGTLERPDARSHAGAWERGHEDEAWE